MFTLDLDVNKAMVMHRQAQVRAAFPRKIRRSVTPALRRAVPRLSATATPRLIEPAIPEPRLRQQQEEKYVA